MSVFADAEMRPYPYRAEGVGLGLRANINTCHGPKYGQQSYLSLLRAYGNEVSWIGDVRNTTSDALPRGLVHGDAMGQYRCLSTRR
jgi:hypothetical protein